MRNYEQGAVVRVSTEFLDANGAAVDPTKVFFSYLPEVLGSTTTLTYGVDAAVVKDSTGNYHVDLATALTSGKWFWRFWSVGSYAATDQDVFYVVPNTVVPLHLQLALGNNAALYYAFNEASGSPADSTANALTATVAGAIDYNFVGPLTSQVPNKAVLFTAATPSYLTRADASALDLGDYFAIEVWLKPGTATGSNQVILEKGTAYKLHLNTSLNVVGSLGLSTPVVTSTTALTVGSWHHIVYTKNGDASAKIYINGVDVSGTAAAVTGVNNATGLTIGTDAALTTSSYNGYMTRLVLYPNGLSAATVAALYAAR